MVGYRTATRLLELGHPAVRIGTRNTTDTHAKELAENGAEIVEFCWDDEASFEPALEGVKIVFASMPYTKHWAKNFPAFVRGKRIVVFTLFICAMDAHFSCPATT